MKKTLLALAFALSSLFAIDFNTASKAELMQIKGIGPKKAEAIIQYRKTHKIKSIEDLKNIKGFNEKTISKIKNQKDVFKKKKQAVKAKKQQIKSKFQQKKQNIKAKKETLKNKKAKLNAKKQKLNAKKNKIKNMKKEKLQQLNQKKNSFKNKF